MADFSGGLTNQKKGNMANNIQSRFGVTVEVNKDIPKEKYVTLTNDLRAALTAAGFEPTKTKVYIHHISIHASPLHFQEGPLSKRMDRLAVKLAVTGDTKTNKYIRFLNHRIQVRYQNRITVESRDARMEYILPGNYCEQHKEFDDYIAMVVEPTCPENLKQISMKITAVATPDFWKRKLINNTTGTAITKLIFPLSQDIQLTF